MSSVSPALQKRLTSRSDKKRVLHVYSAQAGSGRMHAKFSGPDWEEIRLDPFDSNKPDILGDWNQLADIPDQSFDAIWTSHGVQHMFISEVPKALSHCHRILKDGGLMLITVPDLQSIAKAIYDGKSPVESLNRIGQPVITSLDLLYGAFPSPPPATLMNQSAFTAPSIGTAFKKAGFFNIEIKRGDDYVLWGIAYRLPVDAPNKQEKILVNDKYAPRGIVASSGLTDELDTPPHLWKPLNLKK